MMKNLRNFLVVALLLMTGMAQAQMQMTLPTDTAVRTGKLANGLTYYIRHNNWPEHRANFYIAQRVGSIQEDESQRGLAHFLEHMAFNGSDHFKGNNLIEYLRSIGVEFGSDLNAYTSIDQTVYNIDNVPTARQSSLDSCMLVLRDWSTGLSLDPSEIDKERGVIHEEWRLRSDPGQRMYERNMPALYPGSKYGVRFPIGLMSVVDNFKPKELRDYYRKWYHPANQGLIIVGDIDVARTEQMVKKLFSDIKNPENAAPVVAEPVPDTAQPIVIVDKDKEEETSDVSLLFKHDVFPDSLKQSMQYLVYNYVLNAAVNMLNLRYTEEAQKPGCPYVQAGAMDGTYLFSITKDAFMLNASPKDSSQVVASLKAAFVEARKAAEFGFTATEYSRYKENYLSGLDKMWEGRDKRPNNQFYNECKGNFLQHEPILPLEYTYQTMKQLVPAIPLEAINAAMKQLMPKNDSNMVIVNFNHENATGVYPTRENLLAAVQAARTENIQAFVDSVKNEPLIAQMPKAGKIKREVKNDKFGYTELTLSNGVKVVLKKTDYKKDEVTLSGEGEGGSSLYGPQDYVNTQVFNNVIGISGLGNFSSTELGKALAGKIANANLSMSERKMSIDGGSTPKDVETLLQMTYLYMTHINKDPKAFDNLMEQFKVSLKNRDLSPETALSDTLTAVLYGHDPRLAPLTLDKLPQISYDRILQMASERTATAQGWTFTIIGNYDEQTIRPLICQYLGSLPTKAKAVKGKRLSQLVKNNVENAFERKMETPKANAYVFWLNEQLPYSQEKSIQASLAGDILTMVYLKKIREEASAAYTCGARGSISHADDGYHVAQLMAACPMKPEKKDVALKIMNDEATSMAQSVDADMLTKTKAAMVKNLDTVQKTNAYWSTVIDAWRTFGIDIHSNYKQLIEAQTPETIKAYMQMFFKGANKVSVIMMPKN